MPPIRPSVCSRRVDYQKESYYKKQLKTALDFFLIFPLIPLEQMKSSCICIIIYTHASIMVILQS